MSNDAIWIAAIIVFFSAFALTLFAVSIWSAGPPPRVRQGTQKATPARRPEPASAPELRWRGAEHVR